jgi:hypothetical protein
MKREWAYLDGTPTWVDMMTQEELQRAEFPADAPGAPMIAADLPDFVSPIDRQVYSGRRGLREHCQRHSVVPTEDLKGLPPKPTVAPYQPSRREREETKRTIAAIIDSRRY